MIQTPLGELFFLINGVQIDPQTNALPIANKRFTVDQRLKVEISILPVNKQTVIECILNSELNHNINCGAETGEDLALISYQYRNCKLCVGTIGDIPSVKYEYLHNKFRITVLPNANLEKAIIYIAWLTMKDDIRESIFPWFAADPSLSE